jgi:hypothetical protein
MGNDGTAANVLKDEFGRTGGEMRIPALVLLMTLSCIVRADGPDCVLPETTQHSNSMGGQTSPINGSQIKLSIATGGGPLRPAKDIYRVGERVPLVITMTNTGTQPVYVCESDTLYQDRPQLLKNGQPVTYMSFRQSTMKAAETDKACDKENLPQQVLLPPNEPTVVDWFTLADGAASIDNEAWYAQLQPGKYTLSNRRRLSCCDGPLIESNSISFEVLP